MANNLQALQTLADLQNTGRTPTAAELETLSKWRSWGAIPQVFDKRRPEYEPVRQILAELLDPQEISAARRTTINAHFTDPVIIEPIWAALGNLGFDPQTHHVLEPGCGIGGFFTHAPAPLAHVTGVELDPTTAAIAAYLNPGAQILAQSFADTDLPRGSFDVVVGNVPFGEIRLYDPVHNPGRRLSIHNHFLVKSLNLLAPGGVIACLTSRYTLDARDRSARELIAAQADLLGAVRLPTGAHQGFAGTQAVTDLVIFRKREPGDTPAPQDWVHTEPAESLEGQHLNTYFHTNLGHVLGELGIGKGMYGAHSLSVTAPAEQDLAKALTGVLAQITDRARAGAGVISTNPDRALRQASPDTGPTGVANTPGYLCVIDQVVHVRENGTFVEAKVAKAHQREVRDLLAMRDTTLALLNAQTQTGHDTEEIVGLRTRLGVQYDTYLAAFGPINRFTITTRTNAAGEVKHTRRFPPAVRALISDPFAATVRALEIFDENTQTATKAAIFTQRVIEPQTTPISADTPQDALAISLNTHAGVDLDTIADLLGTTPADARAQLGDLVFEDSTAAGALVTRQAFLSGDVRAKHAAAQEAALVDPIYQAGADALAKVVPADLAPADITARIGSAWIPASDIEQFLCELLDDNLVQVNHYGGSIWSFTGNRYGQAANHEWGTSERNTFELCDALVSGRPITVTKTVGRGDDRQVIVDVEATAAAQEKQDAIAAKFADWIWADPERTDRLCAKYNAEFNTLVARTYDGSELTFPGLAAGFTPREHQRAAVARVLHEPSAGLFHEVGAGKTAEMVIAAQELRRLGLAAKPAIVVPNHMLEQFTREYLQLYPRAQLLAANTSDVSATARAQFIARAAVGDWDAIIITASAFAKIPLSNETQADYLRTRVAEFERILEAANERGDARTIKKMETRKAAYEQRVAGLLDAGRDQGLTFEATGIDYLFVDELHMFKNLEIASANPTLARSGSKRASDLDMKIGWLRAQKGPTGPVMTGATATPIANTIAEMYVMQSYLRPDLLKNAGLEDFDSWAATFGEIVQEVELDPTGTSYRVASRFARFTNVPELLRIWSIAADVKTAEDLNLPVPGLAPRPADGKNLPQIVAVEPTTRTEQVVASLAKRAEKVRARAVDPTVDNMLTITSDGRAAALDVRLLAHKARFSAHQLHLEEGERNKITLAAAQIYTIWEQNKDTIYQGPQGPHPNPGALQIVFCDLGTPKTDDRFTAYGELRTQLIGHGMNPARIAFIHDAGTDQAKAELFNAARNGEIDVLVGSTEKMGVGTNVQNRAIALHHLDCPWRPADIAQREGRILRQGNQNPQIQIVRYVTTGTFDAYLWQTVERKAKFIGQVMKSRLDAREIDDIGDAALSAAEVKAIASGDPFAMRKATAEAALAKLTRAHTGHQQNQTHLNHRIKNLTAERAWLESNLQTLTATLAKRTPKPAKDVQITINGRYHTKRANAGLDLADYLRENTPTAQAAGHTLTRPGLVELQGLTHDLEITRTAKGERLYTFTCPDIPAQSINMAREEIKDGQGLITRLINSTNSIETQIAKDTQRLNQVNADLQRARDAVGAPFSKQAELDQARAELATVLTEIEASLKTTPKPEPEASPAPALPPPPRVAGRLPHVPQTNAPQRGISR